MTRTGAQDERRPIKRDRALAAGSSALLHCRIRDIVPNVDQLTRVHASGVFLRVLSIRIFRVPLCDR